MWKCVLAFVHSCLVFTPENRASLLCVSPPLPPPQKIVLSHNLQFPSACLPIKCRSVENLWGWMRIRLWSRRFNQRFLYLGWRAGVSQTQRFLFESKKHWEVRTQRAEEEENTGTNSKHKAQHFPSLSIFYPLFFLSFSHPLLIPPCLPLLTNNSNRAAVQFFFFLTLSFSFSSHRAEEK